MVYSAGIAKSLAACLAGAALLGANAVGCSDRVYDLDSRYEGTYGMADFINRYNLLENCSLALLAGGLAGLVINAFKSND